MDEHNPRAAAISVARHRIESALSALGDEASPTFWPTIQGDASLPLEVLIKTVRRFQKQGRIDEEMRAADAFRNRTYPIIKGIVTRGLGHRPIEEQEQAIQDTYVTMWRHVTDLTPFWEENCLHALHQACISACRKYRTKTHRMLDTHASEIDRVDAVTAIELDAHEPGEPEAQEEAEQDTGETAPAATLVAPPRLPLQSKVETAVLMREETRRGRAVYQDILTRLTGDQAAVLRLIFEEGLSQTEVSQRLGCTPKTVYNRLQHIRATTTAYLKERKQ